MAEYSVGQAVVVVANRGNRAEATDEVVSKIGRKWITVGNDWREQRFDFNGYGESRTGWRSRLYPSREAYEAAVDLADAWKEFASVARRLTHAPAHLSALQIRELTAALNNQAGTSGANDPLREASNPDSTEGEG